MKLITLMDNLPSENKSLVHEHGLSVLLEKKRRRFLFDCGASEATLYNAHRLGVDLEHLDGVILSHSHYDHASGYRDLVEEGLGGSILYTGEGFFRRKYADNGVRYTDLSCGFTKEFLEEYHIEQRVCKDTMQIAPGVWLVGNFERSHAFETIPKRFVKETETGMEPDGFEDEICLAVETKKGLVVLVGCSHPGILNMIETVHCRLDQPVYAVYGGTHLAEAGEERIRETVTALKEMGLVILGFSHCSGELAERMTKEDEQVESCHMKAGSCILMEDKE